MSYKHGIKNAKLHSTMKRNKPTATGEDAFLEKALPGTSAKVMRLREEVKVINAPANRPLAKAILLDGESGTGKNHLARVLAAHTALLLSQGPDQEAILENWETYGRNQLTAILVPGIPATILEAELFGAKRGSYTDLKTDRDGAFAGEGAFILLDEIGDCPMDIQTKLLHVVDTGTYRPLGGEDTQTEKRILLATNRDLRTLVGQGKFRQDLLWRLDTRLTLPALREQPENIGPLIASIYEKHAAAYENSLVTLPTLSAKEIAWAKNYGWPGNIRQLDRALAQFMIRSGKVSLADIASEQEHHFASPPPTEACTLSSDLYANKAVGSLNNALKRELRTTRQAILAWYDECRPDNAVLRKVFPENKPSSVRAKLSQWRLPAEAT